MDVDGSNEMRVTTNDSSEDDVGWHPGGTTLVYFSEGPPEGVWLINADGSNPHFLVEGEDPSFSPDGQQVAYTTGDEQVGDTQISVIDADGSDETPLTNAAGRQFSDPQWAPDGSKLLFVDDNSGDAFVMNPDGSGAVNLTSGDFVVSDPVWSPDGTQIAFIGEVGGGNDIFIMDADAGNPANLTNTIDSNESNLDWAVALIRGDLDCGGNVTPADALILLLFLGDFVFDGSPCPALLAVFAGFEYGDVNCDGVVDELDLLAILAFAAGLPLEPTGCSAIGQPL
jgi:dipeptidyl aminopeptidase/acylaminoacyl peptidase